MNPPDIIFAANTNSLYANYRLDQIVDKYNEWGIKALEVAGERSMTQKLYDRSFEAFTEYYDKILKKIKSNGQRVIATSSNNRENSWVSEKDPLLHMEGLSILKSQSDAARRLEADTMMTPLCTIRGDLSASVVKEGMNQAIKMWVEASRYAAIANDYGPALKMLEIEKMSYPRRDIPSDVHETAYTMKRIKQLQEEGGGIYVEIGIRLDVGHLPPEKDYYSPLDYDFKMQATLFGPFVKGFHYKCFTRDEVNTIVPFNEEHKGRGEKLANDVIDVCESINDIRDWHDLPHLDEVYFVYEPLNVSEREAKDQPVLDQNEEAVINITNCFKKRGYEEKEFGLWTRNGSKNTNG